MALALVVEPPGDINVLRPEIVSRVAGQQRHIQHGGQISQRVLMFPGRLQPAAFVVKLLAELLHPGIEFAGHGQQLGRPQIGS